MFVLLTYLQDYCKTFPIYHTNLHIYDVLDTTLGILKKIFPMLCNVKLKRKCNGRTI